MLYTTVRQVYFSPTGSSKTISETLVNELSPQPVTYDILRHPVQEEVLCGLDDLLVVTVPVFAGRIPHYTVDALQQFQGKGGPAVAVVVYGNRAYEDALLELKILLEGNNFVVGAGAAFVARHSIIQEVGTERPDVQDLAKVREFAQKVRNKSAWAPVEVPGNLPYRERTPALLQPTPDENCTLCGLCVRLCPVRALRVENGKLEKDSALCMACAACISACPTRAQRFRGPQYEGFKAMFVEKFSARKEPEFFL